MKPSRIRLLAGSAACLSALLWACELPFSTAKGGSGTETTGGSKVYGRVVLEDGTAAPGAGLALRSADYLPDTAEGGGERFRNDAVAGADGSFALDSVPAGGYVLEARDAAGRVAMAAFQRGGDGKAQPLGDLVLRRPGTLLGGLGSIAGRPARGWIRAYGLRHAVRAGADGRYRIPGLPSGRLRLQALSSRSHWGYPDSQAVDLRPGDTTRLPDWEPRFDPGEDYGGWPARRSVVLRSAVLGLSQEVRDFPLLVRLDSSHVDFRSSSGRGIRFSDAAGRHLPFAVEHWDPTAGRAAVWVRLDRIPAGSDVSLTLHHGKADAPDRSDPAAVFPDFAGAWQLSDSVAGDGFGTFRDASPHGTAGSGTVEASGPGVAGAGVGFAGEHGIRAPGHAGLRPDRQLSLSAWIRATATDAFGAEIASMGDDYGLRLDSEGHPWIFITTEATAGKETWRICSATHLDLRDSAWHHVAGTYDGATLRLFVDGLERASVPLGEALAYGRGEGFWLGRHGDGSSHYGFHGFLDEVQASPFLRTPAWIGLSEATQRPGSGAVEIR